jgi:hypothetical protein
VHEIYKCPSGKKIGRAALQFPPARTGHGKFDPGGFNQAVHKVLQKQDNSTEGSEVFPARTFVLRTIYINAADDPAWRLNT